MAQGKLYLIPTTLGDTEINNVIPENVKQIIINTKYFIVENIRTTRRYLKKVERSINIDELTFFVLDKRTKPQELSEFLKPIAQNNIGIISESGCPAVADPGSSIVELAHKKNIQVIPLVGPSSILLSIMASGFNGQNFAFVGYIPVNKSDRIKRIKELENKLFRENQTQIFIETPYRNNYLLEDIVKNCNQNTKLCIATDISLESEFIVTKTIAQWKNVLPNIGKRNTIFLLGR